MAAFLAVLSSIWAVVSKVLAAIPWQVWVCLGIFLAGGWVFHGGSCRDFACSKQPRPPRPARIVDNYCTVVEVLAANRIMVEHPIGPLKRRTTQEEATIDDVVIPAGDTAGLALTASLCPVGSKINIRTEVQRWLRSDAPASRLDGVAPESEVQSESEPEPLARGPLIGQVFASNGADVGLELIKAACATAGPSAPPEYIAAEKAAKKKRR